MSDNQIRADAYREAGVDVEAGYESVKLMKADVQKTFNSQVLSHLGGFGGLFELPEGYKKPVLVSGTDGVGTKLKLAFMMDKHDTIGIDCVAMCVNDILCQGAQPLFFLDYIACGKNYPKKIATIVKGISEGCIQGNMALIGGETAEMPDMYTLEEYDLAGFAVGVVEKEDIVTGATISEGDILLGLPASGVHSNGFSLIRKVLFKDLFMDVHTYVENLKMTLGEALLTPTRIYVKALADLIKPCCVKGMSHVTGGGFYENIPRMIPEKLCAMVDTRVIQSLPIFKFIQEAGKISSQEMYSTFNMGIGLVAVLPPDQVNAFVKGLEEKGEKPVILGEIIKGEEKIDLCF